MSNLIIELLTFAVMVIAVKSDQSQQNPESVIIRVPINDEIRRS